VSISDLDAAEIVKILDHGDRYWSLADEPIKKLTSLRGRTVMIVMFEASTRTRTSFELAAKRLSAEAINISGSASSTTKGESLLDTGRNLQAMHPDAIVVRHSFGGAAAMLAKTASCAVINAGDGQHEHPTQALLDGRDHPPPQGQGGRPRGRDRRRHLALARRTLQHLVPVEARRARSRGRAVDVDPRGIELIGGELTRERVRVCPRLGKNVAAASAPVRGSERRGPRNWELGKRREPRGGGKRGTLTGLPPTLPPLLAAFRLQERAAGVGFDWPDAAGPMAKVKEEIAEVEREAQAGKPRGAGG